MSARLPGANGMIWQKGNIHLTALWSADKLSPPPPTGLHLVALGGERWARFWQRQYIQKNSSIKRKSKQASRGSLFRIDVCPIFCAMRLYSIIESATVEPFRQKFLCNQIEHWTLKSFDISFYNRLYGETSCAPLCLCWASSGEW